MAVSLNFENYSKGYLVDNELVAGVSEHPEKPGTFVAFMLDHTTGEYVGYQTFKHVHEALTIINQVERSWKFEPFSVCAGACTKEHHGADSCCGKHSH